LKYCKTFSNFFKTFSNGKSPPSGLMLFLGLKKNHRKGVKNGGSLIMHYGVALTTMAT